MFASDFSGMSTFFVLWILLQAFVSAGWGYAIYRTALAIQSRAGMKWAMLFLPFYVLGWGVVFGLVYLGGSMIILMFC